ncbi:unnamed protein product [Staurois parvus]|uniref:Uncharacterized protein n=1 Tax=Staurois parvus TaxID=386267 RepID=A0ABN9GD43_9NEOB|nr:unnamed protein product [Staurois parvus]
MGCQSAPDIYICIYLYIYSYVSPRLCKTAFDPDFSDPPLLPVSLSYLLIRHIVWSHSEHAQFGVYC